MKVKTTLNIVAEIAERKHVLPMEVWLFTQEEFNTLDFVKLERLQLTSPIVSLVNGANFRYELAPFTSTSNLLINRHSKIDYEFEVDKMDNDLEQDTISVTQITLPTKVETHQFLFIINALQKFKAGLSHFSEELRFPTQKMYFELDQASLKEVLN